MQVSDVKSYEAKEDQLDNANDIGNMARVCLIPGSQYSYPENYTLEGLVCKDGRWVRGNYGQNGLAP